jgi:type IV secretory pathway component VirB8
MESRLDIFVSKEKLEEKIFSLNKELEEKKLEKETLLTKIAILDYVIQRDEKRLVDLKERFNNE